MLQNKQTYHELIFFCSSLVESEFKYEAKTNEKSARKMCGKSNKRVTSQLPFFCSSLVESGLKFEAQKKYKTGWFVLPYNTFRKLFW